MDEDSSTEQKTWQVYSFGKRNVFMLHLNCLYCATVQRRELNVFTRDSAMKELFLLLLLLLLID